ncbi:hypothetical protein [Selenomonas sp. KH1T6]|uniref:hypothetical protein n=1 Tax=Selenomonas sp. KH1T6 TaxID=3158784 RepID=UPI0008A72FCF|nr:hypothetical protein SAMN05216583_12632 [Selenomonas ruminantium]
MNELMMNSKLADAQLENVAGGVSAEAILDGVKKVIAMGASGLESIQKLVDSHEYRRMSNLGKERAIGKLLADNPIFCTTILAQTTAAGLAAMQIKFRTVGVTRGTREFIEREVACK